MTESTESFYWRHARDSLLTPTALRMFQLVAAHGGEVFDSVKDRIDDEYRSAVGSSAEDRHGGIIQTQIQVFREAGWITLDGAAGKGIIEVTPAGKQALLILSKVPDFLKAAPFFVIELLSRYQLKNPARPEARKNENYEDQLKDSTVFPYWTLFRIMRAADNYITADELRRFVFQVKKHDQIDSTIKSIRDYRKAVSSGMAKEQLDKQFPRELDGAVGEPKYLMGRLGTQVGDTPAVVEKDGQSIWRLNKYYLPFIDSILKEEPVFKDVLDEKTWMTQYARPVDIDSKTAVAAEPVPYEKLDSQIPDDDPDYRQVLEMIDRGVAGVLFTGPPGTGKTWKARQVASKVAKLDSRRVRFIQFHASMSYDDFVEGYAPTLIEGRMNFVLKSKPLLQLCDYANEIAPDICVLVIDEINRGDSGRIFGDLLTYIESDYREKPFTLTYSGRLSRIPRNLFIIGTLNPFDKSVVELDDAFDRRFERISFDGSPEKLQGILSSRGVDGALIAKTLTVFVELNKLTRHGLGHAFFIDVKDDSSLRRLWNGKLRFVFEKTFRFEPEKIKQARDKYLTLFEHPDEAGI